MKTTRFLIALLAVPLLACTEEVPQAHKARMFGQTGLLALYAGHTGFYGSVLGPGTVYTGAYDTIKVIDCSTETVKESLPALTKDNVHFTTDIYVTFSANCDDEKVVSHTLETIAPEKGNMISSKQLYETFIRPAEGEALRRAVSPVTAYEVNGRREEIHNTAEVTFFESVKKLGAPVTISAFRMNNLDPPVQLAAANADLASQETLKQKSIAERDRVEAETTTAKLRIKLKEAEGDTDAAKIRTVGKALHDYPEYIHWVQLGLLPAIYEKAGSQGNMIMLPADTNVLLNLPQAGKKK